MSVNDPDDFDINDGIRYGTRLLVVCALGAILFIGCMLLWADGGSPIFSLVLLVAGAVALMRWLHRPSRARVHSTATVATTDTVLDTAAALGTGAPPVLAVSTAPVTAAERAVVREWATAAGLEVSSHGPLPANVLRRYQGEHTGPAGSASGPSAVPVGQVPADVTPAFTNPEIPGGLTKHLIRNYFEKNDVNWCSYRRDEHCWYPKDFDPEDSKAAGYPVFLPLDRGICSRTSWALQQECSVGAPGPHAPPPNYSDGTRRWRDGGQHHASESSNP